MLVYFICVCVTADVQKYGGSIIEALFAVGVAPAVVGALLAVSRGYL